MKAHLTIAAVTAVFLTTLPARADYPLIHHRYIADPCGIEVNGELYIFGSNDDDNTTANYLMHSIVCISSTDLKNWTDHGLVFNVPANCSWATRSWVPQVVARNGKFYLFFSAGGGSIGVASSTSIAGTYTDAKGGFAYQHKHSGSLGHHFAGPGLPD